MLLTEYNEQAHIESERKIAVDEAYAQGMESGIKEGEALLGILTNMLLNDSRTEDLKKATVDEQYREKLYEEYGIKREQER